ncbi:hypothetical protein N2152v2_007200 [Parachlorella kessleri]
MFAVATGLSVSTYGKSYELRVKAVPRKCYKARVFRAKHVTKSAGVSNAQGAKLTEQLGELWTKNSKQEPEDLEKLVQEIEDLSKELGTNKIVPELNDGKFEASAISGRLKKVTAMDAGLTMGGLTFNTVAPQDLKLAYRPLNSPPLFKGEREGVPNAYTLTSSFSVPDKGLAGFCEMVGTYELDKENPQRMHVAFTEVLITPDFEGMSGQQREAALASWLEVLGEQNQPNAVDRSTGRIKLSLAKPAPATLDLLVMVPGWQMTRSNFGSVALLRETKSA